MLFRSGAIVSTITEPEPLPALPELSLTLTAMLWLPSAKPDTEQLTLEAPAVHPETALPSTRTETVPELMPERSSV